jgi:hypothetical protein
MIKFFAPIAFALYTLSILFIGKNWGSLNKEVEYQKTEIVNQNAENKSIVESKKTINKISSMPDDAIWSELFKKYCADCDK